jgi:L-malate glycosyltransferase
VMGGQNKGLEDECKRLAQALGLSDAIEFPGFVNPAQKKAYGETCDIYLNTNRIDNMPVAVVEACAFGMPVVATKVGGIPDLLKHNETGLFVEVDDDDAMVAAILRLFNEPELAAQLSTNGRYLAKKSSWDTVRQEWDAIFDELMEA